MQGQALRHRPAVPVHEVLHPRIGEGRPGGGADRREIRDDARDAIAPSQPGQHGENSGEQDAGQERTIGRTFAAIAHGGPEKGDQQDSHDERKRDERHRGPLHIRKQEDLDMTIRKPLRPLSCSRSGGRASMACARTRLPRDRLAP